MSYAEELRLQMQAKKAKEDQEKRQREMDEMQHEQRIKEQIEIEKEIADEKRRKNGGPGQQRVSFSPNVGLRTKKMSPVRSTSKLQQATPAYSPPKAEITAKQQKYKDLYGSEHNVTLPQAPSPAKAPINRQSYNVYDPGQQVW